MRHHVTAFLALAAALLIPVPAMAVPDFVPVQGYLTDTGGAPVDGVKSITLRLYPESQGTAQPLFVETQNVTVSKGYFAVYLGTADPASALDLTLFRDYPETYVSFAVNSAPGATDGEELTPRLALGTSAYAAFCGGAAYDSTTSGLAANDVQAAIDEAAARIASSHGAIVQLQDKTSQIVADAGTVEMTGEMKVDGRASFDENLVVQGSVSIMGVSPDTALACYGGAYIQGSLSIGTLAPSKPVLTDGNRNLVSADTIPVANLGTGAAGATTYLRGDGAWTAFPAFAGVGACSEHGFVTKLNDGIAPTCTQPGFADLVGVAGVAQGGTGLTTAGDDAVIVGSGPSTWATTTLPPCFGADKALLYDSTNNAFICSTITAAGVGAETAGAVAAHVNAADPHAQYQKHALRGQPNGYASLDGNARVPLTELASGVSTESTFLRGDGSWASLPARSGVGGCSVHEWITALADGLPPTCAQPAFADLSGAVTIAQGGTGLTASAEDAVLVGSGTSLWEAKALPSCSAPNTALTYDTSTNTFACAAFTAVPAAGEDKVLVGDGTTWTVKDLPACAGSSNALLYDAATNTFACSTITAANVGADSSGAATSAVDDHEAAPDPHPQYELGLHKGAPGGYASLDGNTRVPDGQLASGTAGSAAYLRGDRTWAPFPARSGVGACSQHGFVTTLSDGIAPTCTQPGFADLVGVAGVAQGGTGLTATADDAVLVGSGPSSWEAKALPACSDANSALAYDASTNTFACRTFSNAGLDFDDWTPRTSIVSGTTTPLMSVAHNGGSLWVIAGGFGTILTSPDGVTWTRRTSGTTYSLEGVRFDGAASLWVAVGMQGTVVTSPNGIDWTVRASGTGQDLDAVARGGGLWVAVGANGAIVTSPNGVDWTARASGTTQRLRSVAHDGSSLWVATGTNGTVVNSADGTSWSVVRNGAPYEVFTSVAYHGGLWVVVTENYATVLTSSDGATWTQRFNQGGWAFADVAHDGSSTWLGLGMYGKMVTSPDATAWTAHTTGTTQNLYGIASNGRGLWVAAGAYGTILTSGDVEPAGAILGHVAEADPHTQYQKESERGQANGYASLDAAAHVLVSQLATGTASASTYLRGDASWASLPSRAGTGDCAAHTWASRLQDGLAPTCTQPGFADLLGVVTVAQGGTGLTQSMEDAVLVGSGTNLWEVKQLPSCFSSTSALGYNTNNNTFSCVQIVPVATEDAVVVGTGSTWSSKTLPSCSAGNNALRYDLAANAFTCNTITASSIGADSSGDASTAVADHEAASDPHPLYQLESGKDTLGGYVGIGSDGKIPLGATFVTPGGSLSINHSGDENPTISLRDAPWYAEIVRQRGENGQLAVNNTTGSISVSAPAGSVSLQGTAVYVNGNTPETQNNKGVAGGYAGLGASGRVVPAQLGSGSAGPATYLRGDNSWGTLPSCSAANSALAFNTTTNAFTCNSLTAVPAATEDAVIVGTGTDWTSKTLPACSASNSALVYDLNTNAFACNAMTASKVGAESSGAVAAHESAADPHVQYQLESYKGTVNGYAGLDATARVPATQLAAGAPSVSTFLRGDSSWAALPPRSGVGICGAHTWASSLTDGSAPTCTQPGFADLVGAATVAQGGTGVTEVTEDAVLIGSSDSGLWEPTTVPMCSAANSALGYDSGTNSFRCNSFTAVPSASEDAVLVGSGMNWNKNTLPGCSGSNNALAYDATTNTFKCQNVVGNPAGETWVRRTSGTGQWLYSVAYDGVSRWVAVGNGGTILTSPDTVTWTACTSPLSGTLISVAYDGLSRWVAVGTGGIMVTSTDGVTWTLGNSGTTSSLFAVAYGATPGWLAVGDAGTIMTSTDGVAWAPVNSGSTASLRALAHNSGSHWVVTGVSGTILSSPDGASWTPRSSGTSSNLLSVAYNGDSSSAPWVVVGSMSTVVTSADEDGVTWVQHYLGGNQNLWGVTSNGSSSWIAVSYTGQILTSSDALTWTTRTIGNSSPLVTVARDDRGSLVAMGSNGTIFTSGEADPAGAVAVHAAATDPHPQYQKESERAVANGYASLDGNVRVPLAQLGSGTASSSTYLRGDGSWTTFPARSGVGACTVGTWVSTLADGTAPTCTKPAFADLSGAVAVNQGGTGLTTSGDDAVLVGSGSAWQAKTLPSCSSTTSALAYNTGTNGFTCNSFTSIPAAAEDAVAVGVGTTWSNKTLPSCSLNNNALRYDSTANSFTCNTITAANIGAAGLDGNGRVPVAQLGSGTASASTYLRGDSTWVEAPVRSSVAADINGADTNQVLLLGSAQSMAAGATYQVSCKIAVTNPSSTNGAQLGATVVTGDTYTYKWRFSTTAAEQVINTSGWTPACTSGCLAGRAIWELEGIVTPATAHAFLIYGKFSAPSTSVMVSKGSYCTVWKV